MYSDLVMEHFSNPRNVGSMSDADGVGLVGNPVGGDQIRIYIKVKDNAIEDIRFQTLGCGAAIAASSMVTEMVKGVTVAKARKLTNEAIARALGGLPPLKMYCSNLAADALSRAIDDYESKIKPESRASLVEKGEKVQQRREKPLEKKVKRALKR